MWLEEGRGNFLLIMYFWATQNDFDPIASIYNLYPIFIQRPVGFKQPAVSLFPPQGMVRPILRSLCTHKHTHIMLHYYYKYPSISLIT